MLRQQRLMSTLLCIHDTIFSNGSIIPPCFKFTKLAAALWTSHTCYKSRMTFQYLWTQSSSITPQVRIIESTTRLISHKPCLIHLWSQWNTYCVQLQCSKRAEIMYWAVFCMYVTNFQPGMDMLGNFCHGRNGRCFDFMRQNGILHSICWVAARCVTEAFSTTCAVHLEDCEGWWLSGCRSSVVEN